MKLKKPSLKGKANYKYLGHFAQDKFIQAGHNDVRERGREISSRDAQKLRERAAERGEEALSGLENRLKKDEGYESEERLSPQEKIASYPVKNQPGNPPNPGTKRLKELVAQYEEFGLDSLGTQEKRMLQKYTDVLQDGDDEGDAF